MTAYTVEIERAAAKALARIERRDRRRIEDAIETLAADPRPAGAIHLTGVDAYRVRVGDYRVVYVVADTVRVVTVTNVGHRRSIYREV